MMSCIICESSISTRKPTILCDGPCQNQAHTSCISSSADSNNLTTLIKNIDGLSWRCNNCTNKCILVDKESIEEIIENKMSAIMNSFESSLREMKDSMMNLISEKLTTSSCSGSKEVTSYASILRSKNIPAVIIQPENKNQSTAQTKDLVLKSINPVDANLQISKIKNVKDGGLLIGCKTEDENKKLLNLAKEHLPESYNIRVVTGIDLRVRIVGITTKLEDSELVNCILHMNRDLFQTNYTCKLLKFYPTKKNEKIFQAVLQVDKISYNNIIKAGNIFVGYDCCPVFDALEIRRCYKCNKFNHSSKFCNNNCSCPRCGSDHSLKDCTAETLKCSNCVGLIEKEGITVNTEHAVWDIKCPAYTGALNKMRSDLLSTQ